MENKVPIIINGLPLPQSLQELMEEGRWKKPTNITSFKQITGSQFPEDFTFLDIRGMRLESNPIHLAENEELAKIYSLASSKRLGQSVTRDEILDIDKSICIAINWSEEAICLDYRLSNDNPRVMAFVCKENAFAKWKVIAPDFPSFASLLNL